MISISTNATRSLVALIWLGLAGCAGTAGQTPSNAPGSQAPTQAASSAPVPSDKLATVEIGQTTVNLSYAPLYVALDKGYFRDAGIQADFQIVGNTSVLLANGQLDVDLGFPDAAFFNEVNRGLDNKIVATTCVIPANGVPAGVMVRKDLFDSGKVKTLADLKGRKVALNGGKGGVPAYVTEVQLRDVGLTLKDLDVVNLSLPDSVAALRNGSIDATSLPSPFKEEVVRQGTAVLLAAPKPGIGPTVAKFGSKFIRERPEVARQVMVALLRGARDLQGPAAKSDQNVAILSKYIKLSTDTIKASDWFDYDPNLTPNTETILDEQRVFMAEGQLTYSVPLPAERLIDASFDTDAAQKLGPYKGAAS